MTILASDIKELADFLKRKRNDGDRVTLFLGHRTGTLYNGGLYEALKNYANIAEDLLNPLRHDTPIAKEIFRWIHALHNSTNSPTSSGFKKCYSFLKKYFNESGIHTILLKATSLNPPAFIAESELMAKLIKAEFFDTILTTNFDTLLEDACSSLGIKSPEDYRLFICDSENNNIRKIRHDDSRYGKIIKVFGDIKSRNERTVGNEFNLDNDPLLKDFLATTLTKDVMVLGYDPIWDKSIEQAFQKTNAKLWYINEKKPASDSYLGEIFTGDSYKFIGGSSLTYKFFLQTLSNFIGEDIHKKPELSISLPSASSLDMERNKIFISYSHNDKKILHQLQKNLTGLAHLENDANIIYGEVWDDTKIHPGAEWMEEIKNALEQTKVAILLISSDFFASRFIREEELPILLKAAHDHKVEIISVLLGPSIFFKHPSLSKYQLINNESEFLMRMKPYEQDIVWNRLIDYIFFSYKTTN